MLSVFIKPEKTAVPDNFLTNPKVQNMKKLFNFPLILLLFLLNNIIAKAENESDTDNKNYTFLENFNRDYEKAMLESNPDLLTKYWAEDIRLMPEFQKTVMGKTNAEKYQDAFIDRFDILEYSRKKLETLDLNSRIVEFGTFTMTLKLKENGSKYSIQGNYGNIWKVTDDNDPRLITEAWLYSKKVDCAQYLIFDDVPVVNIALESHLPVNSSISFELAAINKLKESFITQHDKNLWSQLYTDESRLFYSNNPVYTGKKEIDAFLEEHVKYLPVFEKLDIRTDRIDVLGEYIIEYASHIAIVKDGDWSGVGTGKNFIIWKRQPDCSLKIYRSMAMYD